MNTIVKADKSRLTIHGVKDGHRYLISQQGEGWWIVPEPEVAVPKRRRKWNGPKRDLSEYLNEMARENFDLTPALNKKVPPCRF